MSRSSRGWIAKRSARVNPKLRMFCLPHAGGGASFFHRWHQALPDSVDVCPVQLPGRESRFGEPLYTRLDDLIPALTEAILPDFDRPFALFGHSMGAVIAFEWARELRRRGLKAPIHLIVSAHRAPHIRSRDPSLCQLPDHLIVEEVHRRYHAIPPEVFRDRSMADSLVSLFRSDFLLLETYQYRTDEPLAFPITAMRGISDPKVTRDDCAAWRAHTSVSFELLDFSGDHFFLRSSESEVLTAILGRLETYF